MESEKEKPVSRITPELIQTIREQFANEWEEVVTSPGERLLQEDISYIENIRHGIKIPRSHRQLYDKLVRIGQDYRLTPDEINELKKIFLE